MALVRNIDDSKTCERSPLFCTFVKFMDVAGTLLFHDQVSTSAMLQPQFSKVKNVLNDHQLCAAIVRVDVIIELAEMDQLRASKRFVDTELLAFSANQDFHLDPICLAPLATLQDVRRASNGQQSKLSSIIQHP